MSPESPAPREPGIQMTGALRPENDFFFYRRKDLNNFLSIFLLKIGSFRTAVYLYVCHYC